jgi:cytochrome oxidase complex assembly protein 1
VTVDYTRPPVAPQIPLQPQQPPPQKSGCWKWGCIGCGTLLLLCAGFVVAIVVFVFGAIKGSEVYRGAEQRVERDPRVIAVVGSPVEPGWWITGNINVDHGGGNADFVFPVHGPKGSGKVYVEAKRDREAWTYTELTFTPENGPSIDLLKP